MIITFIKLYPLKLSYLNNFLFNSDFYLHIKGCAMGTICRYFHGRIFEILLFRKSSDRQNFLNMKLEHPYSLKKSIPDSQALPIWRICSTFQDYQSHSRKLIELFFNKGYKKDVVIQEIQKLDQLSRKQLLYQQKRHDKQYIPLSVAYSRT